MRRSNVDALLLILFMFVVAGCSEPISGRHVVSGAITYQGNPVRSGVITFIPDGRRGNRGPAGVADIHNGSYSTGRQRGVVGGHYVARITAYDGVQREVPGEGKSPSGNVLLEEHIIELELPPEDTTHDFHIATNPPQNDHRP